MKLYIKNMKCVRCKILVKEELKKLGLHHITIKAGEVEISDFISEETLQQFRSAIQEIGLEITAEHNGILVDKIKVFVNEMISRNEDWPKGNFSDHLRKQMGYSYKYLNRKFSTAEGVSIKKYLMKQKIDQVKELLVRGEFSLNQIAFRMNFCSSAHLSGRFKTESGLTPTQFRMINKKQQPAGQESNL